MRKCEISSIKKRNARMKNISNKQKLDITLSKEGKVDNKELHRVVDGRKSKTTFNK